MRVGPFGRPPLAALSGRDEAGRPGWTKLHQQAGVWTTIYQLGQHELLTTCATLRPLNSRHVRHASIGASCG